MFCIITVVDKEVN